MALPILVSTTIDIWVNQNASNVSNSNRRVLLVSANTPQVVTATFIVDIAANDTITFLQAVGISTVAAGIYPFITPAGEPFVPSIIVTINKASD